MYPKFQRPPFEGNLWGYKCSWGFWYCPVNKYLVGAYCVQAMLDAEEMIVQWRLRLHRCLHKAQGSYLHFEGHSQVQSPGWRETRLESPNQAGGSCRNARKVLVLNLHWTFLSRRIFKDYSLLYFCPNFWLLGWWAFFASRLTVNNWFGFNALYQRLSVFGYRLLPLQWAWPQRAPRQSRGCWQMDNLSCTKMTRTREYGYSIHICYPPLGRRWLLNHPIGCGKNTEPGKLVGSPISTPLSAISNHSARDSTCSGDPQFEKTAPVKQIINIGWKSRYTICLWNKHVLCSPWGLSWFHSFNCFSA